VAPILSYPFRLAPDGTVATVEQNSDQGNAEQIGVTLQTIQGERPLQPGFGIPDPVFAGVQPGVITAQTARYGPPVKIVAVELTARSDTETDIRVTFT
jgi:hypothetical protein